jgi:preprotein translocase subunit Sec63
VNAGEILAVVGGLVAGYWLISWLIARAASRAVAGAPDGQWVRTHWDEVLGVRPNASVEDIKAAYSAKLRQYEAAQVDGRTPELRSMALRKTQELSLAYTWALDQAARSATERLGR